MRTVIRVLVAVELLACTGETPTGMLTLAPPTLSVTATTHVLPVVNSTPELQVSASLRNGTKLRIGVAVGTQCPLLVQLSPDPTGEPAGSLDALGTHVEIWGLLVSFHFCPKLLPPRLITDSVQQNSEEPSPGVSLIFERWNGFQGFSRGLLDQIFREI